MYNAAFTTFRVISILVVAGIALLFLLLDFCTPHWPRGRKTKAFLILFLIALLAGIIYFCRCAVLATRSFADLGYGPCLLAIWIILLVYSLSGIAKYGASENFSSQELRVGLAWGCAMASCFITQFTTCASIIFGHPRLLTDEVFSVVFSTTAISTLVLCLLTVGFSVAAKRYAPIWLSLVGAFFGLFFAGLLAPA